MAEELTVAQRAASWPMKVKDYVDELKLEMRRVTWPPWKQVRATTGVVIAAVFVFAIYFFILDSLIIAPAVKRLFDTFTK